MYSSEATFSKALMSALKRSIGAKVLLRIETGETSAGIPDVYCCSKLVHCWLELKNMSTAHINQKNWTIRWRKGQQAFALMFHQTTGNQVLTVVALNQGFLLIPMHKLYMKNIVSVDDVLRVTTLKELVSILNNIIMGSNKYEM